MDFSHEIQSMFFQVADDNTFNYLVLRTNLGRAVDTEMILQETWKNLYPDNTYEGFFQNESFDLFFQENQSISKIMMAIAVMVIIISSMGLFGPVSMYISKRLKEFSIRKVMGASIRELSYQVSKGFIWVILGATILGIPLAYFMSKSVITSFKAVFFW